MGSMRRSKQCAQEEGNVLCVVVKFGAGSGFVCWRRWIDRFLKGLKGRDCGVAGGVF